MAESANLTAVVIGAGWAGEGHIKALRYCGVEILALCSRTREHVESVAHSLGVPIASTDWRASLEELRPDIVTIATPANLRLEVVEVAAGLGCHVVGEKPLAATAAESRQMLSLVDAAGIKHAFAATHRYDPGTVYLAKLIREGSIGALRHIDFTFCGPFDDLLAAWDVNETLHYGGGIMNMGFTHQLGMIERIAAGPVVAVAGEARVNRTRSPVFSLDYHDTREREDHKRSLTEEQASQLEWRPRDGDDAGTVLFQVDSPVADRGLPVTVFMRANMNEPVAAPQNGWRFYGSEGSIVGEGLFTLTLSRQLESGLEALPVPQEIVASLPDLGDEVDSRWAALFRDFVADIRGEAYEPYLTFQDGWRYQEIIDAVREQKGWHPIP